MRRLMRLAAGISSTLVAWGVLVWAAIDFGSRARDGQSVAWVFLTIATIGAAACLFLTLTLVSRVVLLLRGLDNRPPPGSGGKRAAR